MVKKKHEKIHRPHFKHHIRADIIILGCSLPGIVAAHNLRKKFGDSVDVVLLDQIGSARLNLSKGVGASVAFQDVPEYFDDDTKATKAEVEEEVIINPTTSISQRLKVYDNVGRFFIEKYSNEFNIPPPDSLQPRRLQSSLYKLFQDVNGYTVPCMQNYHEFDYLGFLDRFEMLQYQTLLDRSMQNLFHVYSLDCESDRQRLLYLDDTTMETHLSQALTFSKTQDIMRTIVQLVCGTSADKVSVLFYLRQCYRVSSCSNLIDGDNSRFREKLLGLFRRRLINKLQLSVADITMLTKPIKEIRTCSDEQVILEPEIGETDYICDWLALALNPDQLRNIVMGTDLVSEEDLKSVTDMEHGLATKFLVEYEVNFWQPLGFSGDILSIQGPIIWATERPLMSKTRSSDKYVALVGYLKTKKDASSSQEDVLDQLVKLFGEEAAYPVSYTETKVRRIFVPRLGHYVGLRQMTAESRQMYIEWGALDVYAEGDVAAALEAGHNAYVHLLSVFRPQAVTYEDVACGMNPQNVYSRLGCFTASLNVISTTRYIIYGVSIVLAFKLLRNVLNNRS